MTRPIAIVVQVLLAATFAVIPVSRILGAPTLQQVLSLGVPIWLVWTANVVELGGAALLVAGLRVPVLAPLGAALIAGSMAGATLAHVRAGNLFGEIPWTLVFLALCILVLALQWPSLRGGVMLLLARPL